LSSFKVENLIEVKNYLTVQQDHCVSCTLHSIRHPTNAVNK